MLDLKYLTISDLEKYALNLTQRVEYLKSRDSSISLMKDVIKELENDLHQVETEILERTLLGKENPGGATT